MNLRTRLVLALVAIIVLVATPAIYASSRLLQLRAAFSAMQARHGEAWRAIGRLQTSLVEYDQLQRSFLVDGEAEFEVAKDSALTVAEENLQALVERNYAIAGGPAAQVLARIRERSAEISELVRSGKKTEATTHFETVKPLLQDAANRLTIISLRIDEAANSDIQDATQTAATAFTSTLVALGAAIFLAIGLGAWTNRHMVRPIAQLRRAMARVTGGDLQVPRDLPYDRPDEVGDVSRSFRSMTARLGELDTLRAEFMSISTHELKTPINVISGYAELMQEGVLGEITHKQAEALDSIREQTRVLTHMVNQLLDVSRIEAGGLQLEMGEVVLADVFERVHRTFQALARKQDVEFTTELRPDAPRVIPGDADRLRDQVLGNLLSNAFKFTPSGGHVELRGTADGEWMVIDAEDSGPGIPAEQLPHIFDKFYQVGEQARSQGTGLGLTIAHEVVSEHGGSITVDSSPGNGTRFRIRLPTTRELADRSLNESMLRRERSLVTEEA
jgi:signal transduction histidine kinase